MLLICSSKLHNYWTKNRLRDYLLQKYPNVSNLSNDNALRDYVVGLKNHYLKKSQPLSKIVFDKKIHVVNNALGLHSFVSRVQGGKLKSKNEIRISSLFKNVPLEFLNMIVVHELAHLKEKEHNKAFYKLCQHMLPAYHQIEFDVRVYLTEVEENGEVYTSHSHTDKLAVNKNKIIMNYQFMRNEQGRPIAEFDMGSETFSRWFSEELSADKNKINTIFAAIEQLEKKQIKEFTLKGSDISLSLDPYEVEVRSDNLDIDAPDELPEGTQLYDQESISGCGLEDFISVLHSWNDFVSGK